MRKDRGWEMGGKQIPLGLGEVRLREVCFADARMYNVQHCLLYLRYV